MPLIADVFIASGVPIAGANVDAWKASRFSGIPAQNAAPPVGSADAGPVVTGVTFGAQGNFQITVPTFEPYYLRAVWNSQTYWQYYDRSAASLLAVNYGVKADTRLVSDGALTSGQTALTSATAAFTTADVGKYITINDATNQFAAQITAFVSATQVTVASAPSHTFSAATLRIYTDDTAALQAACDAAVLNSTLATAAQVILPPGVIAIRNTINLTKAAACISGAGSSIGTQIFIPADFAGATALDIQAISVTLQHMAIGGARMATAGPSGNVAADGIRLEGGANTATGSQLRDLRFGNINGWCINGYPGTVSAGAASTSVWIDNIGFSQACVQGIHTPNSNGSQSGQWNITNLNLNNVVGGDGVFIDGTHDVLMTNISVNENTGAGVPIHIQGLVAAFQMSCFDVGQNTAASGAVILIEKDVSNNNPTDINFASGSAVNLANVGSTNYCVSITGGTGITFSACDFIDTFASHAIQIGGTGDQIAFNGCTWRNNNTNNAANIYDVNVTTTTAHVSFSSCHFYSVNTAFNVRATGGTPNNIVILGGSMTKGAPAAAVRPQNYVGVYGINPLGAVTIAVPASTVAQTNNNGAWATVHVTGGTVTAISIGGTATGVTSGTFRVPPGGTITLTYSVAPTWQWFLD